MAKFLQNKSLGVIAIGAKNLIPGEAPIEVTAAEAAHPMIVAYVNAGRLALTEVVEPKAAPAEATDKKGKAEK